MIDSRSDRDSEVWPSGLVILSVKAFLDMTCL
jgi:hypothetical protein